MLPPINPIMSNDGKPISYLGKLAEISEPYLKEYGISLNLSGYTETCQRYFSLTPDETEKAWELARELNAWSQYIANYANLIQDLFLDAETEKISVVSQKSIDFSEKTVASGDRYANTQKEVIAARKKRNALKALYDAMVAETEFLERGYYSCKSTAEWPLKAQQRGFNNNQGVS